MIFLEMSTDEAHGGDAWGFANCVWAPTRTRTGRRWPFWTKVSEIRDGDTVLHLRGKQPHAQFVGYSIASGDGFETTRRPTNPSQWAYAESFYRADLSSFTPFHRPVRLSAIFAQRFAGLESYFDQNRSSQTPRNIFYVRQSGRLQCLNGAYLSEVDEDLLDVLFGPVGILAESRADLEVISVETNTQIQVIHARLGQQKFSDAVKAMYGQKCCFPGCQVGDTRFLVGSHIARWSDNELLRGELGNGLCLCLVHDKAFEIGAFTLDQGYRVYVNPRELAAGTAMGGELNLRIGQTIRLGVVVPMVDALLEHWVRVDIDPT